jgi:hypothetical protein
MENHLLIDGVLSEARTSPQWIPSFDLERFFSSHTYSMSINGDALLVSSFGLRGQLFESRKSLSRKQLCSC